MIDLPDDWRGYFVRRDDRKQVVEACRRPQPGRAEEPLADDHPDVVAFFARLAAVPTKQPDPEIEALKQRLLILESKLEGGNVRGTK